MARRKLPLYRKIANSLVEGITSAKYPVGSNLPTEHELSARLKVSRATIVAALDELERLGLVYRRPRVGTQVASRFPVTNQVEEGSVLHDWARYGVEYFFEVLHKQHVSLPREAGEDPARTRNWLKLSGRRVRPRSNRPICTVDVYVHPDYVAIEPDVPRRPPRIFSLIEARFGLLVASVEQELRAIPIGKGPARHLGVEAGSCALEILRWYRGPRNKLIEFTVDTHPADRFTYRTRLHRAGPAE
ncbi:MAG TPA: GntR family transcriptional regulator [Xanthobacteraceae bacterium]|nr:GntR family transcriptional regulator [Xanthobacteraceae bacterium]